MKIITINLPEKYLEGIQVLTDLKMYPSRSETIRIALKEFLSGESTLFKDLEPSTFKNLMNGGKLR